MTRRLLHLTAATVSGLGVLLVVPLVALAAPAANTSVNVPLPSPDAKASTNIAILGVLTLITLAPSILIVMTSFTRILIVFGFLRNALGTPQIPPNQVLVGLAFFLTLFVMAPTFNQINQNALQPYLDGKKDTAQALESAQVPLKKFMLKQTGESELKLMIGLSQDKTPPQTAQDVPLTTLVPAFILSELKTAFQIGFLIYIPFLIIDLIVSATLMSMGMMMLPPSMVSLPFKILLFILVDGWALLTQNLVAGFHI